MEDIFFTVSKNDDYVKRIFREHNQEADHWASLGAAGEKKIVDKSNKTERWRAVRGFWDGNSKNSGGIGCGVIIKGVHRDRWITIGKIAVPLGSGTAKAAEVMGAHVLTSILDLVPHECLSVKHVKQYVDAILKNQ